MPLKALALPVALLLVATPARAGCQVALDGVSFGGIDASRRTTGTGRVRVDCDTAVAYEIAIGGSRAMSGPGGATLDFGLYMDAGRNVAWGDGERHGSTLTNSSDGVHADSLTIYGEIPAQPGIAAGDYSASLLVTLNF